MNNPIISSMPSISAGLPDTTEPNTTSLVLLYLLNKIPHAVCIKVFSVIANVLHSVFIDCRIASVVCIVLDCIV